MGNTRVGVTSGLLAYVFWGVLGIFWELLHAVPALDTLAYRIVWSLVPFSWCCFFRIVGGLSGKPSSPSRKTEKFFGSC